MEDGGELLLLHCVQEAADRREAWAGGTDLEARSMSDSFPKWGQRNRILSSSEFREPVLYLLVGPLEH